MNEVHNSVNCANIFVKLHCKMDPGNELENETKLVSWRFLEIVSA